MKTGVDRITLGIGAVGILSLILGFALNCPRRQAVKVPVVPPPVGVQIVRVIDGDTIDVRLPEGVSPRLLNTQGDDLYVARVRLVDIDAPEKGERGAKEAKAALQRLLNVEGCPLKVHLEFSEKHGLRGRFGRLLAFVWIRPRDGRLAILVQEELVRQGYVRVYEKFGLDPRYRKRLLEAQQEAYDERRGIWDNGE